MNISQVSRKTDLSAKTLRYYEQIGLVHPGRADNGYRAYSQKDVHRLCFVQRARSLGFSIDECRRLLSLYDDQSRTSADVKMLALAKMDQIDAKIANLQALRDTLGQLAASCHGDDRPDCPIIDDLAQA